LKILIDEGTIKKRVAEIAKLVALEFNGQPITVVGVLTGCLIFVADLVRQLDIPVRICFVRASSYRGKTTVPGDLNIDASILLVDDILDSGHTLSKLKKYLGEKGCRSIRTAVLLRKLGRQEHPIEPDYCGFEIPDKFVVGYGLDYNDEYRNLPYIGELN
jgi:hypoxanthine phosphoribosyltransferase